jgi:hypothetical protein
VNACTQRGHFAGVQRVDLRVGVAGDEQDRGILSALVAGVMPLLTEFAAAAQVEQP